MASKTVAKNHEGRGLTVVLRRPLGDQAVFDAIDAALARLSASHDVKITSSIDRAGTADAPVTGYIYSAPQFRLVFTEDYTTGVSFIEVHPASGELTGEVMAALGELPVVTPARDRPFVEENYRAAPGLLVGLVMAEGRSGSAQTIGLVRKALTDRDENVRYFAAQAAGQATWPDFAADLKKVAAGDPDADVREMANLALRAIE